MSENTALAVRTATLQAEVQQLRTELSWVNDADLRSLEESSPGAAWALSLAFGGGGQIYNGDTRRGVALIFAWFSSFLAVGVWEPMMVVMLAISVVGSVNAFRQARAANRYLAARAELQRHSAGQQAAMNYQMVPAQMVPAGFAQYPPTQVLAPAAPDSPTVTMKRRLERLAVLRASGVIDEVEHRERRLEILSELAQLGLDNVDDLLFELLPLIQAGTITREDVDFVKKLGGRR